MIDFSPVHTKDIPWEEFAVKFTKQDLVENINEMTDKALELIADCTDAIVSFQPEDPDAHDAYAENPEDEDLAWNLGHVIVHMTASSEESAFIAAELARGVKTEPRRSRSELPWETITTVQQCRDRLAESRRMLLASLEMWPDEPDLDNFYKTKRGTLIKTTHRFLYGQSHADGHFKQIKEIVRQAKEAMGKK